MPSPLDFRARRLVRRFLRTARGSRRRALAPRTEGLEARQLLAQFVPGEVLIQFKPGVSDAARANARGAAAAALEETIQTGPMRDAGRGVLELVNLPDGRPVDVAIRALQNNPNVEYAEPNWIYTQDATFTSNDPYYTNGSLWGMYGSSTSPANQYGSNAGKAWADGNVGSKQVYVGIIDEGIQYTHPDLADNAWTNPFDPPDGKDNDGNGYTDDIHGWDFVSNDNTIYDGTQDDHGTHVTGTIAAEGGNGIGVAGVDWNVTYISAKFLGNRGGTTANAIKAVDYITTLKTKDGLNIVATNNSWGGGGYSQGLYDAINRANTAGILFVAAAGNDGSNSDATPSYPASYNLPNIISVAALQSDGNLASYSNYGATSVDIAAPGSGIYSTLPNNTYGSYSGTSMATPHVTGAVALYAATHPGAPAQTIRDAILGSAVPTPSLAGKTATGGRLDVAATVSYVPAPPSVPVAPSNLAGTPTSSNRIYLTWSDNSNNETRFEIEELTDPSNPDLTKQFTVIASVPANSISYEVAGLSPATGYTFRVRAFNSNNDPSDYSNNAGATTSASVNAPYTDHFDSDPTASGSAWAFTTKDWVYGSGILQQPSTADTGIEQKALLTGLNSTPNEVVARVRIDSWKDGEFARAGVGLNSDPATGLSYSLLVTGRYFDGNSPDKNGKAHLEFLNDRVAWSGWPNQGGVTTIIPMEVGKWYWFRMKNSSGKLYGKVWADGSPEPSAWTITYSASRYGWNRSGGVASLYGGYSDTFNTTQGASYATASFDDVVAGTSPLPPVSASNMSSLVAADGSTTRSASSLVAENLTTGANNPFTSPNEPQSDSSGEATLADDLTRSRRRR